MPTHDVNMLLSKMRTSLIFQQYDSYDLPPGAYQSVNIICCTVMKLNAKAKNVHSSKRKIP